MQTKKLHVLSAITAGSLALAVAGVAASSGTSHAATHAVLAAQTESFPPVNLDNCPTLYAGYPRGGCVAQLQTELNTILGLSLPAERHIRSRDQECRQKIPAGTSHCSSGGDRRTPDQGGPRQPRLELGRNPAGPTESRPADHQRHADRVA